MPPAPPNTDHTDDLLACAALEPGLRSILVFTSSAHILKAIAFRIAGLISAVSGRETPVVTLTYSDSDDRLWGSHLPRRGPTGLRLRWRPGPLMQGGRNRPRVVLINDLTNMSLPLTRACISLMDAEVATLQRNGVGCTWIPNLCWIAGCARSRIGELSPHLLDRFALRISDDARVSTEQREEDVWRAASGHGEPVLESRELISKEMSERLLAASKQQLWLPAGVASAVNSISSLNPSQGVRRLVALARLARGLARWTGASAVGIDHVQRAAAILDITPANVLAVPHDETTPAELEAAPLPAVTGDVDRSKPAVLQASPIDDQSGDVPGEETVFEADGEATFAATALPLGAYPEDNAPTWRPMESLKLPPRSSGTTRSTEGPAIGTQMAASVLDIAFVSTILEAAKYQNIRAVEPNDFRIERGDLRSYRRAPTPDEILVCLIDYTSAHDSDWGEALIPHLRWGYTSRARISLVQVGVANAGEPLRAAQINSRSLISPAISQALEETAGNASPLAHGLHLALRTLHAALERGRGRAQRARFVILSDGRGNVPLEASQRGEVALPVGTRGVEDAIEIAREFKSLNNVEAFFLDPQPQQYAELPAMLAQAMGAELQTVPILGRDVSRTGADAGTNA